MPRLRPLGHAVLPGSERQNEIETFWGVNDERKRERERNRIIGDIGANEMIRIRDDLNHVELNYINPEMIGAYCII